MKTYKPRHDFSLCLITRESIKRTHWQLLQNNFQCTYTSLPRQTLHTSPYRGVVSSPFKPFITHPTNVCKSLSFTSHNPTNLSICTIPSRSTYPTISTHSPQPIIYTELWSQSLTRRHNSNSFIKSVLDQVKKDIEKQPELRRAMEEMRESAHKGRSNSERFKIALSKNFENFRILFTQFYNTTKMAWMNFYYILNSFINENEVLRKIMNFVNLMVTHTLLVGKYFTNKFSKLSQYWKEDPIVEKRAAEWRQSQAIKRYQKQQQEQVNNKTEQSEDVSFTHENKGDESSSIPLETSLILSKSSAWDRFGTRLKDMPFLQSFYENPFFGKIFGETEIAASIREMKIVDSSFKFPEFMEMVQEIVAPHLVQCFLDGDQDSLRIHCGDAAFSAAVMSIKERNLMKVSLDPTILRFHPIDLIGAKRVEDDTPWFIFSFTTQQINCLRDIKGNVISGAVDDIRDVVYSIALTKHPDPDLSGLHHPWMIKEFAILGSNPSW